MSVTVVDTDILIDAGRQVREAVACLDDIEQKSALAVSVITQDGVVRWVSQQD